MVRKEVKVDLAPCEHIEFLKMKLTCYIPSQHMDTIVITSLKTIISKMRKKEKKYHFNPEQRVSLLKVNFVC